MKIRSYIDIKYKVIISYFNWFHIEKVILKEPKQKTRPYDDENSTSLYS